ncbi:stabilizer of axonemal microtubules 4-like [Corticium candelabrum]|uniref:stabilizer of axonemal microtubules 4-like n=1 Tax=Corticium candelabrum TaxID=121492 RepID=UPI002E27160B|nr:stabilizer of axonemal microtubules 4-like [Corticium candelabrum]
MRLPYGPATAHILVSRGSEIGRLNFYSTNYSTSYGQNGFLPRTKKHHGTGYLTNFRPAVYYTRNVDEMDYPLMGQILSNEYGSLTQRDFRNCVGPQGKEPVPQSVHMVQSGFVKDFPITRPTSFKVREVFVDTREKGVVGKKYAPYLRVIQPKDPIEKENAGHGPGYMTTENSARFLKEPNGKLDTSTKTVGRKEGSGFTHAINIEPITYRPPESFRHSYPNYRPVGMSMMRQDYTPNKTMQGNEHLRSVSYRAQDETGYTTGNRAKPLFTPQSLDEGYSKQDDLPKMVQNKMKKNDPAEWVNATVPNNKFSLTQTTFRGKQRTSPTQAERLQCASLGPRELTGFSENHDRYIQQPPTQHDKGRFTTHHSNCFWNKNPQGAAREGHTEGKILQHSTNGFTKSTAVHGTALGNEQDSTALLRSLNPYQAKSIKKRDPSFNDHTHDSKLH